MSLSMYQASVPVFLRGLGNMAGFLAKAADHASERKIDPAVLLASRLYPDMFPLTRQVQLTTDFANRASARLAGVEVPTLADTEQTFEDLQARIARTKDFIAGLAPARIDGSEERELTIPMGGKTVNFSGRDYLLGFALPNFYFHMATAYGILRHNGVELGKRDFMGQP